MNRILTFLFFITCLVEVSAQEPHMRQPKTVEELLQQNRPNEYRALVNHEKYLVIDKVGGKKRRKRFIGEEFNFRNDFGARFYGQLTAVTDSTFSLTYFDETMQKNINRMFYIKDVELIFKRNLKPGIEYKFNPLMFLPFALDWIYFKRPPWQSVGSLALLGGIEAGRVMIGNRHKFYNRIKINERNRLLVFQY